MCNEDRNEKKQKALEWGKLGEEIAFRELTRLGVNITHRNWRCGNRFEIDIISEQGDEMVFIEVKTRNGRYNSAEDAIDEKKMRQLVQAANIYLQSQERDYDARFDVVLVEGSPDDYEMTYLRDAFIPPL